MSADPVDDCGAIVVRGPGRGHRRVGRLLALWLLTFGGEGVLDVGRLGRNVVDAGLPVVAALVVVAAAHSGLMFALLVLVPNCFVLLSLSTLFSPFSVICGHCFDLLALFVCFVFLLLLLLRFLVFLLLVFRHILCLLLVVVGGISPSPASCLSLAPSSLSCSVPETTTWC